MRFLWILLIFVVFSTQKTKCANSYPPEAPETPEEFYESSGPSSHRPPVPGTSPGPRPGLQPTFPSSFPPSSPRPGISIPSPSPPLILPPLPPSPQPPLVLPPLPPSPPPRPPSTSFPPISPGFPSSVSPGFPTPRPEVEPGLDIYEVMPAGEMAQLLSIDVQCSMTSMRIRISFDRPFNGVIYAKGFFADPNCHYVPWGSNLPEYEFEVTLDRCGTQFIDNMASGGTANLEAILLIQNEPHVQEMWDIARRVQCTWQGQIDQTVQTGFQVDMLDTLAVAYSGDDVSAEMDIQVGRGPFAPRADGLLKIGEPITVVIYVFGSGDMDVHVRDCIAHDGDRTNSLQLTDEHGCIVKKKLMGAWQFTRQTGTTGASLIAYANMQSFRFPDKTDVYLECGLDICKGECADSCPEYPNIDYRDPPRSKRNVDPEPRDAILVRTLRVMDESVDSNKTFVLLDNSKLRSGEVCMSTLSFSLGLVFLIAMLVVLMLTTIVTWFRMKVVKGSTSCPKLNNW